MALVTINKKHRDSPGQNIFLRLSAELENYLGSIMKYDNKSLIKEHADKLFRVEFEIKYIDPLAWLTNQKDPVKVYWADREKKFEFAAAGKANEISYRNCPNIKNAFEAIEKRIKESESSLKYFGGAAFDQYSQLDDFWKDFGNFYFIVPQFEIFSKDGSTFFAANVFFEKYSDIKNSLSDILYRFNELNFGNFKQKTSKIKIIKRMDLPEKQAWVQNIETAVNDFKKTGTKKIVLARKTLLEARDTINPLNLLNLLKNANNQTYDFCLQIKTDCAFLGCSPERLFEKKNEQILSEALAGSIAFKGAGKQDISSKNQLLSSQKDIEEHQYVFDKIFKDMQQICNKIEVINKRDILTLSYVQHIYSQFRGELKSSSGIYNIISKLHPTPAVFGYPENGKMNLMEEIRKYEPFERGWYASPLGWIGKNNAEFAVGIRSGLVNGNILELFSGAGIVKASIPESEWEEIENKVSHFLKVLV